MTKFSDMTFEQFQSRMKTWENPRGEQDSYAVPKVFYFEDEPVWDADEQEVLGIRVLKEPMNWEHDGTYQVLFCQSWLNTSNLEWAQRIYFEVLKREE